MADEVESPVQSMEWRKIGELEPNPNNPRVHPDSSIEKIRDSVREFGFTNPMLVVNGTQMVAGHGRLKALLEDHEEDEEVPVVELEMTLQEAEAYMIADNRIQEESEWDESKLGEFLNDQDLESIPSMGFDDDEVEQYKGLDMDSQFQEQNAPAKDDVPDRAEAGDLWKLGQHRLVVGDSSRNETMKRLMRNHKADMVFTDPPYGVSYTGGKREDDPVWEPIEGDDKRGSDLKEFLQPHFNQLYEWTSERPAVYISLDGTMQWIFRPALEEAGFQVLQQLIWKKGMVISWAHYNYNHEPIFYVAKDKTPRWYSHRGEETIRQLRDQNVEDMDRDELIEFIEEIHSRATIQEISKGDTGEYKHPTQKPVELPFQFILNSSAEGDVVLDPFGGSGSTMIAAEQADRHCYMAELEPTYANVIIDRWQDESGNKAERIEQLKEGD